VYWTSTALSDPNAPDPCTTTPFACNSPTDNSCLEGPRVFRWNPPGAPVYQPASASSSDAPQGYLKGYRVYMYDEVNGYGHLLWIESYNVDGLATGKDTEWRSNFDPDSQYCHVVTGLYKVFANGNWLTEESGWSSNFYASNAETAERCPTMRHSTAWCSLPLCSALETVPKPAGLTATPGPALNQITVSWSPPLSGGSLYPGLTGYYLYVHDPLGDPANQPNQRVSALFRNDHPYLRLDPETTSVVLKDMDSDRDFSFSVVSIDGGGRLSEPAATVGTVRAPADPSTSVPVPTNLRVRLWTGNDYTYGPPGEVNGSTGVIRVMWDWAGSGTVGFELVRCTDPVDEASCTVAAILSGDNGVNGYERTLSSPMGETRYYRVKAILNAQWSGFSAPVAGRVLPHDDPPLSPPSHLDAVSLCDSGPNCVRLQWCPNLSEEAGNGVLKYRVFRSEISQRGLYVWTAKADLASTETTWLDPDSLTPASVRYYYVMAAVRVVGGAETVSGYSQENGAGNLPGLHRLDPDSWFLYGSPNESPGWSPSGPLWQFQHCNNDDVENRLDFGSPFGDGVSGDGGVAACVDRPSQGSGSAGTPVSGPGAAPYRLVGSPSPISSHITYYHLDHLGTPRSLTDSTGLRVQGQHFLPFGEEMPVEAGLNSRKFTGHERDPETGLDYMVARYYEAPLGRFLSPDPGNDTDKMNPQSLNLYAYVRNNPLGATDPTGTREDTGQGQYHPTPGLDKAIVAGVKSLGKSLEDNAHSASKQADSMEKNLAIGAGAALAAGDLPVAGLALEGAGASALLKGGADVVAFAVDPLSGENQQALKEDSFTAAVSLMTEGVLSGAKGVAQEIKGLVSEGAGILSGLIPGGDSSKAASKKQSESGKNDSPAGTKKKSSKPAGGGGGGKKTTNLCVGGTC